MAMQLLLVYISVGPIVFAYGNPAPNEDSSTCIMPRSLKKGCKLNSYY